MSKSSSAAPAMSAEQSASTAPKPKRARIRVDRRHDRITITERSIRKQLLLDTTVYTLLAFVSGVFTFAGGYAYTEGNTLVGVVLTGVAGIVMLALLGTAAAVFKQAFQRRVITIENKIVRVCERHGSNRNREIRLEDIESFALTASKDNKSDYDLLAWMARGQPIILLSKYSREELEWVSDELLQVAQLQQSTNPPKQRVVTRSEPARIDEILESRSENHFLPNQESDLEEDLLGAVQCTKCDSTYRASAMRVACHNCGAPLKLRDGTGTDRKLVVPFRSLERLMDKGHLMKGADQMMFNASSTSMRELIEGAVICGYCDTKHSQRPQSPNCPKCAGTLPPPPSTQLGPPPESSRPLPLRFIFWLAFRGNAVSILWITFITAASSVLAHLHYLDVAIPGFVLAAILCFLSLYRGALRLLALKFGTATPGQIESVHAIRDDRYTVHRMYYRFSLGGTEMRGVKYSFSPSVSAHFVGEPVWVLVVPWMPKANDLWPPFN